MAELKHIEEQLKQYFCYEKFLPGQKAIIEKVLSGRDSFVLMPTGGGKSLIYQLSGLLLPGVTIIVSPLIALMQDQVDRLQLNGIAASFVNSTLSFNEQSQREQAVLTGQTKLLYVAPERLLTQRFLTFLDAVHKRRSLSLFAIDEAHCVSEWGHDFRPEYRQLSLLRKRFTQTPIIALTATATERVRADILDQLLLKTPYIHIASFDRPNLYYEVRHKNQKTYHELLHLLKKAESVPAIIYCQSRKSVEQLTFALNQDNIPTLQYHAGLSNEERTTNQKRFIRDDVPVLVATIAFGMGIAKPDVRSVIHYDLPKSLEGYYQESGRAGRDGQPAQCVLFFQASDRIKLEYMLQQKSDEELRIARQQIQQVILYGQSLKCRRQTLLAYFSETYTNDNCGQCDNCLIPEGMVEDRTIDAQKFLSCISRTQQRFGMRYIIDILRGANTQKIRDTGHNQLTTYGIGKDLSIEEWQRLGRGLIQQGLLEDRMDDGYSILKLNRGSVEILKKVRKFELAAPALSATVQQDQKPKTENLLQELSSVELGLFQHLRTLRKQLADELSIPPYAIFPDNSLQAMARQRPQNDSYFMAIPGVGQRKLEAYGTRFMAAIGEYCQQHGLDINRQQAPAEKKASRNSEGAPLSLSRRITLDLYLSGRTVDEIAQERNLKPSTIVSHLAEIIEAGETIDVEALIRPDHYASILEAFQKNNSDLLSPVKELLGDEYPYEELRLVRAMLRQQKNL